MTVAEAISRSAVIYPAEMDKDRQYGWLSELEQRIAAELYGEDCDVITKQDGERILSVPDAYAELYPLYLIMKRELACGDTERYNNYASCFNRAYSEYANFYNRNKAPGSPVYITLV